jgi:tetratricopeptide (TPR) repeat protein
MNHHFKGFIFYLQEKYEKAIPHFEKSLSLSPNLSFPKLYWGQSLLLMGKKEDGLEYFQNFPEDKPGELTKLGGMTLAYSALGNIEKAFN